MRSAITFARCPAVGGAYIPKRLMLPPFTAAFVESAEASGNSWKIAGQACAARGVGTLAGRSRHRWRPSPRRCASTMGWCPDWIVARTANCYGRPDSSQALKTFKRLVQVPDRHTAQLLGPGCKQCIVRLLVTIDHVWDQRPVKARVPVPLFNPAGVAVYIEGSTFVPDREGAIVEDERLANVGDNANVVLSRKGTNACRPARKRAPSCRVPPTGVPWYAIIR